MNGFAVLLAAAAIAFGFGKLFRLPAIPLLMLSGMGLRMIAEYSDFDIPEMLLGEMIEI